jgi:adenylate cyclase
MPQSRFFARVNNLGGTEQERHTTVLFADVAGSTRLYETAGDAKALEVIAQCIERMSKAAESTGGRVVKTIGDEVMALFASPDAAASAASEMHGAIEAMPVVGDTRLGVRIGFHAGPVIQRDNDVFGDTVNLASRLVEQAQKGQIITSQETAAQLSPAFRTFTRKLYSIQVKGKAEEVELCEVLWRVGGDMTSYTGFRPPARSGPTVLRIKYRGKEIARRREADSVTIGREESNNLQVHDQKASRQHCTIERRQDKWVLKDHSTNGTFVTAENDSEIMLQREEFILRKHGWIAFGQPRSMTEEVAEYFCD